MKKVLCLIAAIILLPCACFADIPDISGLSYDELVELRQQLNLAIWNSQEWQKVTVEPGIWEVGVDIPAGHWTITPVEQTFGNFRYVDRLNETKTGVGNGWHGWADILNNYKNKDGSWYDPNSYHRIDLEMVEGMYVINNCPVYFEPFTGKPDLGFQ